jgi:hypothetical protein
LWPSDTGELVPAPGVRVVLRSSYGFASRTTDEAGVALFDDIEKESRWVPSTGPESAGPRHVYHIRASLPDRSCRAVTAYVFDDRGHHREVKLVLPKAALFNVTMDAGFPPARKRYLEIRAGDQLQEVNLDAIDACIFAGETVQLRLLLDDVPVYEWRDVVMEPGRHELRVERSALASVRAR